MIYVLAFFFPYIALAIRGLWIQAIFNFILSVIGFVTIIFAIGGFLCLIASIWGIVALLQQARKKEHQEMLNVLNENNANNN